MAFLSRRLLPSLTLLCLGAVPLSAREVSFEERVRAQEAVERVTYSHQIGATLPFEEAVPRALLERRVRDYLRQSAALEQLWRTPVAREALRAEMERIARSTRLPERLREIYGALDHDPILLEECFARPSLVERLARSFFSGDQRIHGPEREEIEALRERLTHGAISPGEPNPRRSVGEISVASGLENLPVSLEGSRPRGGGDEAAGATLGTGEFRHWRSSLPEKAGEIGPVLDRGDAFAFQVILSETQGRVRVATYSVPKKDWSTWWEENRKDFNEASIRAVASSSDPIPEPAARSAPAWTAAGPSGPVASPTTTTTTTTTASTCLQAFWDNDAANVMPDFRTGHVAVWTGSFMVVWGGVFPSNSDFLITGWKYDPLTDAWSRISDAGAPAGRRLETVIWTGDEMIVWGGEIPANPFPDRYVNTGGRYNPATDTWSPTSTVGAPGGRISHTAVWTGDEMIVSGGLSQVTGGPVRSGGRYDPDSDSWSPMADSPPLVFNAGRYDHSAVWTGTEMLVWGGRDGNMQPVTAPVRYDPVTDGWSSFGTTGQPTARYSHAAVWTGSRMIIWGGSIGGTPLNSGGQYDPSSDTWSAVSTTGAPSGGVGFWTGSLMLIWDGGDAFRYDPDADTWSAASDVNAPRAVSGASVVWAGGLMIVWGGGGGTYTDTGGRYDPVTDTWTPTSMAAGPSGRDEQTAVWTGGLMIVWGGKEQVITTTVLSTGSRYNPVTDTWSPTSMINVPSARRSHTAIWTGQVMVIWGGRAAGQPLRSGGAYNPISDSWSAISELYAPGARYGHTAVWTGSRMIVWGGRTETGLLYGDGSVYLPALDSWNAFSGDNHPSARYGHTAVWTGSEMVVWGGTTLVGGVGQVLNDGGRFEPIGYSWTPIAPSVGRTGHSAVWTGLRMLIWGGQDAAAGYPSEGAQYDPFGGGWFPITAIGAPVGRRLHSAVWTGEEMVVWGGRGAGDFLNSGSRYDPALDAWFDTPLAGAPMPRTGHSAVWIGTEMIVWGGTGHGYMRGERRLGIQPVPVDVDDDGYDTCNGDCDDSNPSVHPGAVEACNGIDEDCDGTVDEGFDQDGDTFKSCGGDCDDGNPAIHPGAVEICNALDDNCDGSVDEGFEDLDADGSAACGGDCDDGSPAVHPGAPEICDGLDNDCNSLIDEGFDLDGDGGASCFDCNDADPQAWYAPFEVYDLIMGTPGPSDLAWDEQGSIIGPAVVYDLSSGTLGAVPGIDFGSAACLQSGVATSATDGRPDPSPGSGFWYLARARSSCGAGTYGAGSFGGDRILPDCP